MKKEITIITFAVLAIMALGFIAGKLSAINSNLVDMRDMAIDIRQMSFEMTDANWIMACKDISKVEMPETYEACNPQ